MRKEYIIGVLLGVISFLFFLRVNMQPFIILAIIAGALYFIMQKKGLVNVNAYQEIKPENNFAFDDIGGQTIAKRELKEALDFLINSTKISQRGIRPLKGILLTGPPGTGKTLLAKASATYSDAVFLATSGSEFIEMYAGVGAQRVRKIFNTARTKAKKDNKNRAIIFIDEIDVIGGQRGSNGSHMEYDQTLNQFLVEMDGISGSDINILVIGATNRPDLLDSALLRPGRFDRQVKVDLPENDGRLEILKLHTKNKVLAKNVNLEEIADETYGFSGAHLENVTNEAAILALRENAKEIDHIHIKEAIDKVMLGEKLNNKTKNEVIKRIAYHEAGHAIVSEVVNPNSVSQVTVTSRGNALGYVRQVQKDQKLYTENELRNQIKICLAGSLAEKLCLGNRSTGSSNDFEQAIKLAKNMIHAGLSSLGVISIEDLPAETINNTISEIIKKEEDITQEILNENLNYLEEISSLLVNEEKITGEKIREILDKKAS
ncbi:ATP-dependent metalloprotease FtsH [Desulfonispora thiosulfatigenes DSM 11270]|uniref:ATP-dependent metalloprotease FtsH n=1 Tax=Desulfonispora thiosulfatigenes DSM 11270 TaxID=656914 RepID=A0A1W1VSG0_DESTI|nr:AAA family ATPase [Desulfonispora thiosulfatigenes]SMB96279.1 ATP-dependent metalloprotease FtsH [Desulfonispora thiosulfatigenes DSM 11270]